MPRDAEAYGYPGGGHSFYNPRGGPYYYGVGLSIYAPPFIHTHFAA